MGLQDEDISTGSKIIRTIHYYNKLVKTDELPALLCPNDDGYHMKLLTRIDDHDNVYLYCMSCNWEKRVGWSTQSHLLQLIRSVDTSATM